MARTLQCQIIIEITPLRVVLLDRLQLPGASPLFDPLLPHVRILHGFVKLREHQCADAVIPGKTIDRTRAVLRYAAGKIAGDADIEGAVASARGMYTQGRRSRMLGAPVLCSGPGQALGPRFREDDEMRDAARL